MLLKPDSARGSWERHLPILYHSQTPCDVMMQVCGRSKAGVQVMEEKGVEDILQEAWEPMRMSPAIRLQLTTAVSLESRECLQWHYQHLEADNSLLRMGDRSVHCGVFSSIPHLYPPTRRWQHLAVETAQNAPSHCQMSLRDQHFSLLSNPMVRRIIK